MSFEADLKAHLQSDSTISGLVNARIFPKKVPEEVTMPVITYTNNDGEPQNCLDGFTSGVVRYDMQIDCWATTFTRVIALGLAVRNRLNTVAATFSSIITQYPALDDYEEDTKRYRRSIGVICWFKE